MDTPNPAAFVNAQLLRMYLGWRVRAVIQVLRSDGGDSVFGKSTDEQQLVIKGRPLPLFQLSLRLSASLTVTNLFRPRFGPISVTIWDVVRTSLQDIVSD
ncbi:hypothetical protein OROMI_035001 [Orobanche minor]